MHRLLMVNLMKNDPELQTSVAAEVVLEAKGLSKRFPGVLANDRVDFDLRKGEIHCLLGENGAGKSTLMNILYGLYQPDEGTITVKGELKNFHSPNDAIKAGIGMVHQHFMLIPVFTAAENIMLGEETLKSGFLDMKTVKRRVKGLIDKYHLDVPLDQLVEDLPVGVQQRIEIIKALYRDADILILDEPSAVLTPQEVEGLYKVMHELTDQGVSIIFITHKLKEVLAVSDRITVMRAGKVVGTITPQETNEHELANMMVGREVILTVDKGEAKPAEQVISIQDLHVSDDRGVPMVRGVSFDVRAGEILGVAGIQGNGQTQLVEALTGLRKPDKGKVVLSSDDVTGASPRVLVDDGLAHIPEDRQKFGLVLPYSLADNLVLCTYFRQPFAKGGVIQQQAVDENARRLIEQYDVRTPSPFVTASTLSGGNQQKVIVAREFSRSVKLLIANQPTRGLDVGSIEYIHSQIIKMRDEGAAVIVVSAELDEIMGLADRIVVMFHGEIVGEMPAKEATKENLGLLMVGIHEKAETIS